MTADRSRIISFQVQFGFTLIELLVVVAILAVLAALLLPTLSAAKESTRGTHCLSNMRQIALAVRLYADDHNDEFPRSQHSAFAYGQLPWGRAIAPELASPKVHWSNLLATIYHCPSDKQRSNWSYGQNVYFELDPKTDDYPGMPMTWRHIADVPRPSANILDGEIAESADHIMPQFWDTAEDAAEAEARRHRSRANYAFVDGHAYTRRLGTTFDPKKDLDLWNPDLAR